MQRSKLESLTFLRFVAAAIVVIFHFGSGTDVHKVLPVIFSSGPIMVTFFFVLSGFVISISHVGRSMPVSEFYLNRLARIAPIYLVALAAFVFAYSGPYFTTGVILSAGFLQAWFPPFPLSANAPGWSISVEMFFYAISPLLLIVASVGGKQSHAKWLFAGAVLWIGSQFVLAQLNKSPFYAGYPSVSHDLIYYFPVSHLCSFILGFAGGIAYRNNFLIGLSGWKALVLFFISLMVASYIAGNARFLNDAFGVKFAFGGSFYAAIFLPVIYLCVLSDKLLSKVLALPFFVLLGEASYSLYILQKPAYVYFDRALAGFQFSGDDTKFYCFFLFLIIVSIVSYLVIEKPVVMLAKKAVRMVSERRSEISPSVG